jgi:hypothetical protein
MSTCQKFDEFFKNLPQVYDARVYEYYWIVCVIDEVYQNIKKMLVTICVDVFFKKYCLNVKN